MNGEQPAATDASPMGIVAFLKVIGRQMRAFRGTAAVVFVCLLLEMAFHSSIPLCFKFLVDRVLTAGEPGLLPIVLGSMSAAVALVSMIGLARDYLAARMITGLLGDLRERMFAHLQKLPLGFYSRTEAGETLSRFSGDLAVVEQTLLAAVPWAVLPGLDVLASSALLFILDWRLALIAMLVFPMSLLGPRLVTPRAARASLSRRQGEASAMAQVQENIAAQPVVKAFSLEDLSCARFRTRNATLIRNGVRLGFLSALVERSGSVGIYLLQVAVLGFGAWAAARHEISIGTLAAFQTLFLSLSYSLSYVTQYLPTLVQGCGAMHHIDALLAEPPRNGDAPSAVPLPRFSREIGFNDVTFSYDGERPSLSKISVRIAAGESVALVGASGSGKSTMLNLIMRFHEPDSGAILMDGVDLRRGTLRSLRTQTSIVFQESFLFNTSVRENIRLGKPDATDEEVVSAAIGAEIHHLILSWPEGYDTVVGERGGRLSGGERQRVAIARALVRDPAILILDEATSALDPATEAKLNETLARAGRGRTVLSVTHRLASVAGFDRILVFDAGRLVEEGTHAALLLREGHYARLWRKASGFTLNEAGDSVTLSAAKLRELPFFQGLSEEVREILAPLFVTEQRPAGRVIVTEGEAGNRFYLIARGRVGVYKKRGENSEEQVAVLEAGDFFGEIALLEHTARTATVRTLTPVLLLCLHREQFLHLSHHAPALRAQIDATARSRATPAQV